MISEQKRFCESVRHALKTFDEHKRKLLDLSPRFWVALLVLEAGCAEANWDELRKTFGAAHRRLGAPGDFGYGTPCGDALRDVYDSWGVLCAAHQPETEKSTPTNP